MPKCHGIVTLLSSIQLSARLYYGDFSKQKFAVTGKKTPYQITIIVKIESSKCAQFELEFLQFKTVRPVQNRPLLLGKKAGGVFEPARTNIC